MLHQIPSRSLGMETPSRSLSPRRQRLLRLDLDAKGLRMLQWM